MGFVCSAYPVCRIELKSNKNRHIPTLGSRVTSLVSVALVLFLLGIMAFLGFIGANLSNELRHNLGFIIRMEQGASESAINNVKEALTTSGAVSAMTYFSSDEIYAQEQALMGEDFSQLLDVNPYSAEFDVKVKTQFAVPDSIAILSASYEKMSEVEEVISESTIINGIDRTLRRAGIVTGILVLLLGIVAIALIRNAVYLSVYSRRFIIHTMKLVGATGSFIRRPFVRASVLNGLVAGIIATALVTGLIYYATSFDPIFAVVFNGTNVFITFILLIITGMLICGLTAAAATNKYLRSTYDEMFMK